MPSSFLCGIREVPLDDRPPSPHPAWRQWIEAAAHVDECPIGMARETRK